MKKDMWGTFPVTCPVTALPVSYRRRLNLCIALSTSPPGHPRLPAATCIGANSKHKRRRDTKQDSCPVPFSLVVYIFLVILFIFVILTISNYFKIIIFFPPFSFPYSWRQITITMTSKVFFHHFIAPLGNFKHQSISMYFRIFHVKRIRKWNYFILKKESKKHWQK